MESGSQAALPAIRCGYGGSKPLQIAVRPSQSTLPCFHRVYIQHLSQQDSYSLCTPPVKPLASVRIQQHPLEQQQLARANASTPHPSTSPASPARSLPHGGRWRRVSGMLLAAPRLACRSAVAALAACNCRAEQGRSHPREHLPQAGLS